MAQYTTAFYTTAFTVLRLPLTFMKVLLLQGFIYLLYQPNWILVAVDS